jgi:hypothetical protein
MKLTLGTAKLSGPYNTHREYYDTLINHFEHVIKCDKKIAEGEI